nr:RDD family protein [Cutibacterium modestum]
MPAAGRGSLASWGKRVGALVIDWGASMVLASAIFGPAVVRGGGWPMWMPMAVFFVESVLFTAVAGGSFGQIVARVVIIRLDGLGPIGWWRAVIRTAMKCLIIPAVVIGAERRGLDDLVLGTVVVNRK